MKGMPAQLPKKYMYTMATLKDLKFNYKNLKNYTEFTSSATLDHYLTSKKWWEYSEIIKKYVTDC
jgi:hypothetical protein